MALIFPPTTRSGSRARSILQERRFRLTLRCNDCRREEQILVEMVDEPEETGTEEAFVESGALDHLTYLCDHCQGAFATLTKIEYVRASTDVDPSSLAA